MKRHIAEEFNSLTSAAEASVSMQKEVEALETRVAEISA